MIAAEEFTFPVISSNAANNLSLLPPLWRIADSEQTSGAARQRRPFARQISKIDDAAEAEGAEESQETMDQLWEDFNEESADNDSEFSEETSQNHSISNNCGRDGSEECANMRQLKLIRAKPKKMESLVKVMKKLFSLHTNQHKTTHH